MTHSTSLRAGSQSPDSVAASAVRVAAPGCVAIGYHFHRTLFRKFQSLRRNVSYRGVRRNPMPPLFEMKRHPGSLTLTQNVAYPIRMHGARSRPALSARNHPINRIQSAFTKPGAEIQRPEQGAHMRETALRQRSATKMEAASRRKAGFPPSYPTRRSPANRRTKEPSDVCSEVVSLGAANPATASARSNSKAAFSGSSAHCDARTRPPCSRRKLFSSAL